MAFLPIKEDIYRFKQYIQARRVVIQWGGAFCDKVDCLRSNFFLNGNINDDVIMQTNKINYHDIYSVQFKKV